MAEGKPQSRGVGRVLCLGPPPHTVSRDQHLLLEGGGLQGVLGESGSADSVHGGECRSLPQAWPDSTFPHRP